MVPGDMRRQHWRSTVTVETTTVYVCESCTRECNSPTEAAYCAQYDELETD